MKVHEIDDTQMLSVFCYDIRIDEIPVKSDQELSVSDIQVKMDKCTVTVKSVKVDDDRLSVDLGVILIFDGIQHVTRSTRSAIISVSDHQYPPRTGNPSLASDIVEVHDLKVVHHTIKELIRPIMGRD